MSTDQHKNETPSKRKQTPDQYGINGCSHFLVRKKLLRNKNMPAGEVPLRQDLIVGARIEIDKFSGRYK